MPTFATKKIADILSGDAQIFSNFKFYLMGTIYRRQIFWENYIRIVYCIGYVHEFGFRKVH